MNQNPTLYPTDRPMPATVHAVSTDLDASHRSAVSWSAIFAGAAGAASLSLILLILGAGLGLSSVSPFSGQGVGAAAFGISTIVWLCVTQLLASGMGGYLAGRLRTRWTATHADEVYFRDTAHGFLAWAIASLATAAMLSSAIGAIVGTDVQAGVALSGGAAATAAATAAMPDTSRPGPMGDSDNARLGYFVDTLMRGDQSEAGVAAVASSSAQPTATQPVLPAEGATKLPVRSDSASTTASKVEVTGIVTYALAAGAMPQEDSRYIADLIATRTGMAQDVALKTVNTSFAKLQSDLESQKLKAREAADKARKASSYAMLWVFISLLAGAFVASLFATMGGRRRDL